MTHPAQFGSRSSHDRTNRNAATRRRHASAPAGAPALERLEQRQLFALTVNPYLVASPATELANEVVLPNTGITVTGATYQGVDNQSGTYSGFDLTSGQTRLALSDGVLLTTGLATAALGPNNNNRPPFGDQPNPSDDTSNNLLGELVDVPGDPDLSGLVGDQTFDAAALTLTFTTAPGTNSVLFDFIFATEEFPEFVGSFLNDAFGVYLDGVLVSFDANGDPITVQNNFFQLNNSGVTEATEPRVAGTTGVTLDIEYDGLTPVIRTRAPLNTSLATHTIKFVIADTGDSRIDSAAFISRLQGSGAPVGQPTTDLPDPGVFNVSPPVLNFNEQGGTATFFVTREGGASGLVTVDLATVDGSAQSGVDYTGIAPITLTFTDQQATQQFTIPILDDPFAEGDETFLIQLSNPTNVAGLGENSTVQAVIVDNELGVEFTDQFFTIEEGIDTVFANIGVRLTKASTGVVTAEFATVAGGSATAGTDYQSVSQVVTFQPGETEKTVTVPVFDDYVVETTPETVNLRLANFSAPYIQGINNPATLVIFDLIRPPAVLDAQFVTNERFINGVALRYSEAMTEPNVEDVRNYDIYLRKESRRLGGSPTRTRMEIVSAVYEPASRSVTLTTARQLRENRVYEVIVNTTRLEGVESIEGDRLDGNYDNLEGDDFTGYLSRATRIDYFDREGDRVNLRLLKGPGRLELFRDVERNARLIRMIDTSQDTILTGSFNPVEQSDNLARIRLLLTGSGFRNRLPQPPFSIRETINASIEPNT